MSNEKDELMEEAFEETIDAEEFTEPIDSEPATAVATTKKAAVAVKGDFDFDFSEFETLPGVVSGDIGVELSRFPVERIKFTKAYKSLISIVTDKVVATKCHYMEGVGSFFCFGGKCCQVADLPRVKYNFPAVIYDTNRDGRIVSKKMRYGVLSLGPGDYQDIVNMSQISGDPISSIDLLITCKEEQYQDISIIAAGKAKWKQNPGVAQEVKEFWSENMQHLLKPIGRKMSEKDLDKALGAVAPSQEDIDFNSVF